MEPRWSLRSQVSSSSSRQGDAFAPCAVVFALGGVRAVDFQFVDAAHVVGGHTIYDTLDHFTIPVVGVGG